MKKIMSVFLMIFVVLALFACGNKNQSDVVKQLGENVDKLEKFSVDAVMEIKELNKTHIFDVNIKYQAPNYYKVTLKNRDSNNVQIVLKNDEGVFVLTPALNKSFKFQSDWPLNSSQPYLYQSIVKDIMNDKDAIFAKQDNGYVFETKVDYRRSRDLTSQKIIIDEKTMFPKEVYVFDGEKNVKISCLFTEPDFKSGFNGNEFKVEYSMTNAINMYKDELPTFADRAIMWPTFLIEGTTLAQEVVKDISSGKRAIMTFEGTAAFTVIENYINIAEEMETVLISGDPVIMASGIAFQTDNTLIWHDNGIEFYLVSEHITTDQMYMIANSFVQDQKD